MSSSFIQSIGLVAAGAAGGGVARYALVNAATMIAPGFPLGTIAANMAGCLVAGMLLPTMAAMSVEMRLLVLTGFLGGLTTMSGFTLDTLGLYRDGQTTASILYWATGAIGNILACVGGFFVSTWARQL